MDLLTYALVKKKTPIFLEDNVSRYSSVSPFSIPVGFTTKEYISSPNNLGYPVKPPFVLYSYKNKKVVHQYIVSSKGEGYFQRTGDVAGNSWNDWEPLGGGGLEILFNDGKSVGIAHKGDVGDLSTVVGYNSDGKHRGSTLYGSYIVASNVEGTALGSGITVNQGSVGVGRSVNVGGIFSVAVGTSTKADGGSSVAVGYKANASIYDYSIAIGAESNARVGSSMAIGYKAVSMGISIGPYSESEENSLSLGFTSKSKKEGVALGHFSNVVKENGVAVGAYATSGGRGISIGKLTASQDGVSIGNNSNSSAQGVSVGINTVASSFGVAVGSNAKAEKGNGVAVGSVAYSGTDGVSIGNFAKTGDWSVAVGNYAQASGAMSTSLGNRTNSSGTNVVLIGNNLTVDGNTRNTTVIKNSKIILDGDVEMPKMGRAVVAQNAMLLDMEMREIEREIYGG